MEKKFNTPVLFLIFNRPDKTQVVFNRIKEMRPTKLYVAADGPRVLKNGELERCQETRAIINQIDWPCELKTLFRDNNLGCGKAVSSAISWFFENEEMGIILEDDCLPSKSFFNYCEKLLEKYKNNERIYTITGYNFFAKKLKSEHLLYSRYTHVWGWATWRRVWQKYDFELSKLDQFKQQLRTKLNIKEYNYWINQFEKTKSREIDTWDYQLQCLCFVDGGLTVLPPKNLIKNIGFDESATHTTSGSWLSIDNEDIQDGEIKLDSRIEESVELSRMIWKKMHKKKSIIERIIYKIFKIWI